MKKWLAGLLCVAILASLWGCDKQGTADTTTPQGATEATTTASSIVSVGICLPNQNEERWTKEGVALKTALEAKNYKVSSHILV